MTEELEYHVVTKADRQFYPGVQALLESLSRHARPTSVTVLDCGLTARQRSYCLATGAVVERLDLSRFHVERPHEKGKYTPAIYGFLLARLRAGTVTVHLDADTIVLGSLDPLVRAAEKHGIAAVPDFPPLSIDDQIGVDGPRAEVFKIVPHLNPAVPSFNAGVFAVRADYYEQRMMSTVQQLTPFHNQMWGNDQAILNLAAYAANSERPFYDIGRQFNCRPRYRRSPTTPPPRYESGSSGPILWCAEGRVHVLHFVGQPKPWQDNYPLPCGGHAAWKHFQQSANQARELHDGIC